MASCSTKTRAEEVGRYNALREARQARLRECACASPTTTTTRSPVSTSSSCTKTGRDEALRAVLLQLRRACSRAERIERGGAKTSVQQSGNVDKEVREIVNVPRRRGARVHATTRSSDVYDVRWLARLEALPMAHSEAPVGIARQEAALHFESVPFLRRVCAGDSPSSRARNYAQHVQQYMESHSSPVTRTFPFVSTHLALPQAMPGFLSPTRAQPQPQHTLRSSANTAPPPRLGESDPVTNTSRDEDVLPGRVLASPSPAQTTQSSGQDGTRSWRQLQAAHHTGETSAIENSDVDRVGGGGGGGGGLVNAAARLLESTTTMLFSPPSHDLALAQAHTAAAGAEEDTMRGPAASTQHETTQAAQRRQRRSMKLWESWRAACARGGEFGDDTATTDRWYTFGFGITTSDMDAVPGTHPQPTTGTRSAARALFENTKEHNEEDRDSDAANVHDACSHHRGQVVPAMVPNPNSMDSLVSARSEMREADQSSQNEAGSVGGVCDAGPPRHASFPPREASVCVYTDLGGTLLDDDHEADLSLSFCEQARCGADLWSLNSRSDVSATNSCLSFDADGDHDAWTRDDTTRSLNAQPPGASETEQAGHRVENAVAYPQVTTTTTAAATPAETSDGTVTASESFSRSASTPHHHDTSSRGGGGGGGESTVSSPRRAPAPFLFTPIPRATALPASTLLTAPLAASSASSSAAAAPSSSTGRTQPTQSLKTTPTVCATCVLYMPDGKGFLVGTAAGTLWYIPSRQHEPRLRVTALGTVHNGTALFNNSNNTTKTTNSSALNPSASDRGGGRLPQGSPTSALSATTPPAAAAAAAAGHTTQPCAALFHVEEEEVVETEAEMKGHPWGMECLSGHSDAITSLGLNDDGGLFCSGSLDGSVILWSTPRRDKVRRIQVTAVAPSAQTSHREGEASEANKSSRRADGTRAGLTAEEERAAIVQAVGYVGGIGRARVGGQSHHGAAGTRGASLLASAAPCDARFVPLNNNFLLVLSQLPDGGLRLFNCSTGLAVAHVATAPVANPLTRVGVRGSGGGQSVSSRTRRGEVASRSAVDTSRETAARRQNSHSGSSGHASGGALGFFTSLFMSTSTAVMGVAGPGLSPPVGQAPRLSTPSSQTDSDCVMRTTAMAVSPIAAPLFFTGDVSGAVHVWTLRAGPLVAMPTLRTTEHRRHGRAHHVRSSSSCPHTSRDASPVAQAAIAGSSVLAHHPRQLPELHPVCKVALPCAASGSKGCPAVGRLELTSMSATQARAWVAAAVGRAQTSSAKATCADAVPGDVAKKHRHPPQQQQQQQHQQRPTEAAETGEYGAVRSLLRQLSSSLGTVSGAATHTTQARRQRAKENAESQRHVVETLLPLTLVASQPMDVFHVLALSQHTSTSHSTTRHGSSQKHSTNRSSSSTARTVSATVKADTPPVCVVEYELVVLYTVGGISRLRHVTGWCTPLSARYGRGGGALFCTDTSPRPVVTCSCDEGFVHLLSVPPPSPRSGSREEQGADAPPAVVRVATLALPCGGVCSDLAWSPDSRFLVAASSDGWVYVWERLYAWSVDDTVDRMETQASNSVAAPAAVERHGAVGTDSAEALLRPCAGADRTASAVARGAAQVQHRHACQSTLVEEEERRWGQQVYEARQAQRMAWVHAHPEALHASGSEEASLDTSRFGATGSSTASSL